MLFKEKNIYIFLSAFLFIYLVVKSVLSPLVYDEATTFLIYVQRNEIFPWQGFWSANNHILNSILVWLVYKIFGPAEVVLRLPNLLAFILFVYYLFKIGTSIPDRMIRWSFWVIILLGHFFIEFFSLSRGYGLSFALLAGVIWNVHLFENEKRIASLILAFVFALLATLANLNLFFIFLIVTTYAGFRSFQLNKIYGWMISAIGIGAAALFASVLLKLRGDNQLYIGGDINWFDSFDTVFYQTTLYPGIWLTLFALLLLTVASFFLWRSFLKERSLTIGMIAFTLLLLNFIALTASSLLFHSNLPYERTALHLYFLLFIALCFGLSHAQFKFRQVLLLPFLLIPIKFFAVADVDTCSYEEWAEQQIPANFYETIAEELENGKILTGPLLSRHWHYYNFRKFGRMTYCQDKNQHPLIGDYMMAFPHEDLPGFYQPLMHKEETNLTLYKKKQETHLTHLKTVDISELQETDGEFLGFSEIEIADSLFPLHIRVEVELNTAYPSIPADIVFDAVSKEHKTTLWEQVRVDYLFPNNNKYIINYAFHSLQPETSKLMIYLFNTNKIHFNSITGTVTYSRIAS